VSQFEQDDLSAREDELPTIKALAARAYFVESEVETSIQPHWLHIRKRAFAVATGPPIARFSPGFQYLP
jgi:hypothetical protein